MNGPNPSKPARACDSEIFDVLLQAMAQYNQRFVSGALTTTGALLVAIGWLLTSADAQKYFAQNRTIAAVFVGAIVPLIYIYCSALYRAYRVNHEAHRQLQNLNYMEKKYYSFHLLPPRFLVFGIFLNVWHYFVVAWLVAQHAKLF
ncbi:hypothetical protein [Azohydromonas caseinilytica]|uniref:Uncharacterized protein n=1 Tax=Azohydromonas caseinilytica TaxID=2728836 RepID=A0A848FKI9_9BURK|nr:hypothetical protein [Azohydromonas caseinilytica]NML18311.1 hypothetical protein [Azohydromonas caseinilytica]